MPMASGNLLAEVKDRAMPGAETFGKFLPPFFSFHVYSPGHNRLYLIKVSFNHGTETQDPALIG